MSAFLDDAFEPSAVLPIDSGRCSQKDRIQDRADQNAENEEKRCFSESEAFQKDHGKRGCPRDAKKGEEYRFGKGNGYACDCHQPGKAECEIHKLCHEYADDVAVNADLRNQCPYQNDAH